MTDCPIKGNQTRKIEIDMGSLNCVGEPYIICLGGHEFILRYSNRLVEGDSFGTLFLEAIADDAS